MQGALIRNGFRNILRKGRSKPKLAWPSESSNPKALVRLFSSISSRFEIGSSSPSATRLDAFRKTFAEQSDGRPTTSIEQLAQHTIGSEVLLKGYLGDRSDVSKRLSFVPLIDSALRKSVQIIASTKISESAYHALKAIPTHSPVTVIGRVKEKVQPKAQSLVVTDIDRNSTLEIELLDVQAYNNFPSDITFQTDTQFAFDQRHLQLRQSRSLRDALSFRADVIQSLRDLLRQQSFLEVETPLLFKSTPEGAREFLVPTRRKGLTYALPQSPQQYKQILMASGIPRYFQVAKCFRDEDLRADRQPEFTQLDMEMSFVSSSDVRELTEKLIKDLWKNTLDTRLGELPFPILSYNEAMMRFGSDKPDIRLGAELSNIFGLAPADFISKVSSLENPKMVESADPIVLDAFCLKIQEDPAVTREFVSDFMASTNATQYLQNPAGQPGMFIYDSRKPLAGLQPFGFEAAEMLEQHFDLEDGDLLVVQARKDTPFHGGSTPVGNLRLALARAAVSRGLMEISNSWTFLWVVDFPLFEPTNDADPGQGGSRGIKSTHHPFTAPASIADLELLNSEPLASKADHYDLVLNGIELGGGSARVHDADLQRYILEDVLKIGEEPHEGLSAPTGRAPVWLSATRRNRARTRPAGCHDAGEGIDQGRDCVPEEWFG